MRPYEERVVAESSELRERLEKLTVFIGSELFTELHEEDQNLLAKQQKLMADYLEILRQRIVRFEDLA